MFSINKKVTTSVVASVGAMLLTFSFQGCATKVESPLAYSKEHVFFNVNPDKSVASKSEMIKEVISKSRYGTPSGDLDYGVVGYLAEDGSNNLILDYVNNSASLDGIKKSIVRVTIPFSYSSGLYKSIFGFSDEYSVEVIMDDMDQLDSIKNIKSDVLEITNPNFMETDKSTIDFDPKNVKFGVASDVQNGLLHAEVEPVAGYVSNVCTYNKGCAEDTHFQSIDVTMEDGERVTIVQSITDGRYEFIHNNDNVYLFQLENNSWVVKLSRD